MWAGLWWSTGGGSFGDVSELWKQGDWSNYTKSRTTDMPLSSTWCVNTTFYSRLQSSCASWLSLTRWVSSKVQSKKCCLFMKITVRELLKNSWHAWLKQTLFPSDPKWKTQQILPSDCGAQQELEWKHQGIGKKEVQVVRMYFFCLKSLFTVWFKTKQLCSFWRAKLAVIPAEEIHCALVDCYRTKGSSLGVVNNIFLKKGCILKKPQKPRYKYH